MATKLHENSDFDRHSKYYHPLEKYCVKQNPK